MKRKILFVGCENSQTTMRPPFFVTRNASFNAAVVSDVFQKPNEIVVTSNVFSVNGKFKASPC